MGSSRPSEALAGTPRGCRLRRRYGLRLVLLADAGVAHVVALGVGRPCVRHGQIAGAQQCRSAGFIGCEYIEVGMAMMLIRMPAGDDPARPAWLTGLVL